MFSDCTSLNTYNSNDINSIYKCSIGCMLCFVESTDSSCIAGCIDCILIDTDADVNILMFVTDLYPGWRKFSTSGNLLLQYQNLLRLR